MRASALPVPVQRLAAALASLPGIGPRSAERLALHLATSESAVVDSLADAMVAARKQIAHCQTCGALTESQPCPICSHPSRDPTLLCIVEHPVDVLRIEKSNSYNGRYHVLGGRLSPIQGVEPEDLRIAELEQRVPAENVREIILALGSDVEGDATSNYLAKRLAGKSVRVTRLAQGLPAGGGLEFADELTLSRALAGRQELPS